MSDHGFTRCDGEFEVIGEDLNMSTMGIVQMTLAELWKAPDISRELALLDAHYQNSMKNKEDKQMLAIGTKVIVRTCNDYNGRYTGKIGTVCKHWNKSKRVGVTLDGIKNPDSKEGVFWFAENSVMLYKQPTTMLNPGNVKSVIFSGDKTIILWDDGTKTIVTCGECGFDCRVHFFTDRTTEDDLMKLIHQLNMSPSVHGIMVQLPLPPHINRRNVISAIDPEKDVDCLHPLNVANNVVHQGRGPTPCTPAGIMKLLQEYRCDPDSKRAVVIGRSDIVGVPMAFMLQHANATVTVCHSHTKDLAWITHQADILVSAVGQPGLVIPEMVKPGAVVIDVGITSGPDGKLHGDVDFERVKEVASHITPVPGGVGPMTRAMLMRNMWEVCHERC